MKTRAASFRRWSVRLVVSVLLLAPGAFACGKSEERPPVTTQPASPTPFAAPPGTRAPAVSAAARLPATAPPKQPTTMDAAAARLPATVPPKQPVTTDAAPPPPPPPPPSTAATSDPPPTTPAERQAAPQRPKGRISLPAKLGAVSFDHEKHASEPGTACTTCHHPSRPQKPLASESQACRDCHTMPAVPPMQTSLQAAFHDPKGAAGTCVDCHKKRGGSAPVKCLACHKKKP